MRRSTVPAMLATTFTAIVALTVAGLGFAPPASAKYQPKPGITFNNPLGKPAAKHRINDKIIKTIRNTGKRQEIRVHSWNIRHGPIVDALIAAHKRGVSVRVLIWRGNASKKVPNAHFDRLQRQLKKHGNKKRPASRKSGARKCKGSCRGKSGLPHSKYLIFSQVNGVKHVVMYGGHNLTTLAGTHQWNEISTITRKKGVYDDFRKVFNQSYKDKPVKRPWVRTSRGKMRPTFHPHQGPGVKGDPVRKDLRKVRCNAKSGKIGINGNTKIRIAMTSWHGERGKRIARQLVRMQNQGCNIKIVYAVMGNEVLRILRQDGRKRVPHRQITQDFNGDGVYDRYLHTKVLAVQGNWNGKKNSSVVLSGSSNWSPLVLKSDEADVLIRNAPGRARQYARYVDRLFANPPRQARVNNQALARMATGVPIDPYANIEVD